MSYDDISIHLRMLSDRIRTDAYRAAIRAVVRPGDTVIDFGCGTGVLSLFASFAGAEAIYAIDRSPLIHSAKAIADANGASSIRFLACDAGEVEIDRKADVLVSEWMGHFGLYEWMLEPLIDLRTRYLRKGGTVIPERVSFVAAFVTDRREHERLSFFRQRQYGIDFSFVEEWPFSTVQLVNLESTDVDDSTLNMGDLTLADCVRTPAVLTAKHLSPRSILAMGLCGWFRARLSEGIEIDTGPFSPRTHWRQLFFPFGRPLEVNAGDVLDVSIWPIRPEKRGRTLWRWQVCQNGVKAVDQNDFAVAAWLRDRSARGT
jgi:precorrin-6B methylase 2